MSALNRAAAYAVAQTQILVVQHSRCVLAIVTDQGVQALSSFRRAGSHPLESTNHAHYLTRTQVFCYPMHPSLGIARGFPVRQSSKLSSVLHRVPEVENFTSPGKHSCPFPDPLGAIPDDDYNGVSTQPA